MNGLGNMLKPFLLPLAAGILSDRASYSIRNKAGCESSGSCVMDPGNYVGTADGRSWSVTTEEHAQMLAIHGAQEYVVHFSDAGVHLHCPNGTVEALQLPDLFTALAHPSIADAAWVRFVKPQTDKECQGCSSADYWGLLTDHALLNALQPRFLKANKSALSCLFAWLLFPLPGFQTTLGPYLQRLQGAHKSGGAVVAIHLRTGYADYASSSRSKPAAVSAVPSECTVFGDEWDELQSAYPPLCLGDVESETCTSISNKEARLIVPARGATCVVPPDNTSVLGREGGQGGGILTTLLNCAALKAIHNSSNTAHWLLYVAGDLPAFVLLANSSRALAGHVMTAAGAFGHISFSKVCRINAGESVKTCLPAGIDPGGAWTRSMVDWFVLGSIGVRRVRMGKSSFPSAAALRATWPVPDTYLDVAIVGPLNVQAREELWRASDAITHQLELQQPCSS